VGVERGVGEALAFVFTEETTVAQLDAVNLVAGVLSVTTYPLFISCLSFPRKIKGNVELFFHFAKKR
jgi:hypothetical protein